MKNILAALAVCLIPGAAVFAQKNITLSGVITNPVDDKVTIVSATSKSIIPATKPEVLTLSKEGKFEVLLPATEQYNWIVLVHKNQRIDFFAKEGSKLTVTARGNALDSSIQFQGSGKDVPEFFAGFNRDMKGIMGYFQSTQEIAVRDTGSYLPALDSVKKVALAYTAKKGKALPAAFTKYWKTFLDYSAYDAMLHYPVVHEMIRQRSNNVQSVAPELYAVTSKTPAVFADEYLDIPFYQTYVQSYYSAMLTGAGFVNRVDVDQQTGMEDRSKVFQQTDSALHLIYTRTPQKTGEFAAGRILATESVSWPVKELESRVAAYKKQYPRSEYNKELDNVIADKYKLEADIRKFDVGNPGVDFTFKTLDGKTMKLSDLKGKVVYMDFWASWCGPCKGEMPHAKQIKEHFKDKEDVVFLYVSIDEKEEAWKKGIETLAISGIHTRTPGWGGEIAKLYRIESVPAYFLIDKQGKFVTKKTPRPSQSDELIKLIEGLL